MIPRNSTRVDSQGVFEDPAARQRQFDEDAATVFGKNERAGETDGAAQGGGKTQDQFSKDFKLPIGTVRDWEQHRREPETGSKVYLSMIEADPEGVRQILAKV
jgi:hypothetical protein